MNNRLLLGIAVFATEAEFRQFVQQREVDFTGGWARVGVVLHLGRR